MRWLALLIRHLLNVRHGVHARLVTITADFRNSPAKSKRCRVHEAYPLRRLSAQDLGPMFVIPSAVAETNAPATNEEVIPLKTVGSA